MHILEISHFAVWTWPPRSPKIFFGKFIFLIFLPYCLNGPSSWERKVILTTTNWLKNSTSELDPDLWYFQCWMEAISLDNIFLDDVKKALECPAGLASLDNQISTTQLNLTGAKKLIDFNTFCAEDDNAVINVNQVCLLQLYYFPIVLETISADLTWCPEPSFHKDLSSCSIIRVKDYCLRQKWSKYIFKMMTTYVYTCSLKTCFRYCQKWSQSPVSLLTFFCLIHNCIRLRGMQGTADHELNSIIEIHLSCSERLQQVKEDKSHEL